MKRALLLLTLIGCGPDVEPTCNVTCRSPMVCDPTSGRCVLGVVPGTGGGAGGGKGGGAGGGQAGGAGGGASGPGFCALDCVSCAAGYACTATTYSKKSCQTPCTNVSQCQAPFGFTATCTNGFCFQDCPSDAACAPGMACSPASYAPHNGCRQICSNAAGCGGFSPRCVDGFCQEDLCDDTSCGSGKVCAPSNNPPFKYCQQPCTSGASCPTPSGFVASCE